MNATELSGKIFPKMGLLSQKFLKISLHLNDQFSEISQTGILLEWKAPLVSLHLEYKEHMIMKCFVNKIGYPNCIYLILENSIATPMARNRGHRNGARAGFLRNMAAKRSKEMYGRNKTK